MIFDAASRASSGVLPGAGLSLAKVPSQGTVTPDSAVVMLRGPEVMEPSKNVVFAPSMRRFTVLELMKGALVSFGGFSTYEKDLVPCCLILSFS